MSSVSSIDAYDIDKFISSMVEFPKEVFNEPTIPTLLRQAIQDYTNAKQSLKLQLKNLFTSSDKTRQNTRAEIASDVPVSKKRHRDDTGILLSEKTSVGKLKISKPNDDEETLGHVKLTKKNLITQKYKDSVYFVDPYEAYKNAFYIDLKGWSRNDVICGMDLVQVPKNALETYKFDEPYYEEKGLKNNTMEKRWKVFLKNDPKHHHLVKYDAYKRVTFSPDEYDEKQSYTIEKLQVNHMFRDLLLTHARPKRQILYLDSPAATTSRILHEAGYMKDQLHVPNPNQNFIQHAPKNFNSWAKHYDATLYEWMRDLDDLADEEYDIGADYCCNFLGNAVCRPKADITLMFQNGLFAKHNGVMWLTFSKRCPFKGQTFKKTQDEVIDFVCTVGKFYHYNIRCVNNGDYGTVMYFFFVSQ